jgi:multiple sugar transport system permease protein
VTVRRHEGRASAGFILPAAAGLAVFTVIPIVAAIVLSLFDYPLIGDAKYVGLANFRRLFNTDPLFWQVFRNTFVFVLWYVPANFAISLALAALISPRIKGRSALRTVLFVPVVAPLIASAAIFRLIFDRRGIANQILGTFGIDGPNWTLEPRWAMLAVVVLSLWLAVGYNIVVYSAALDAIPDSVLDAATMDGASSWTRFWRIQVPLITPSIFFATVLTLITSFQVFAQAKVLTDGGPRGTTTTLVMHLYNMGFKNRFELGYAASIGMVLFVIIVVVSALQFRLQKRWVHYES